MHPGFPNVHMQVWKHWPVQTDYTEQPSQCAISVHMEDN